MSGTFDIQGHRGARGLLPENTIPSFRRAAELGARTVELDVVMSADSQIVVSHDPVMLASICSHPDGRPVTRTEQEALLLMRMPYEEIRRFDCGARGNDAFPDQMAMPAHKPLLSEVVQELDAYARELGRESIHYNIEIKSSPEGDGTRNPVPAVFAPAVLELVLDLGIEDRADIQSFDPRVLVELHNRNAPVELALLIGGSDDQGVEANLAVLGFTPAVYSPEYRLVGDTTVAAVHARGMRLVPWTVNDPEEMRRLIAAGVDGLITDYPDRAAALLKGDEATRR